MRNTFMTIAAAAAVLASPAAAQASPVNSTDFSATVDHDDLDLTTQRGIARLDDRVRTEIRRACANGSRDSASLRLERECRSTAFAAAESEVQLAIVSANANRILFAANSAAPAEASTANTPGA